MSTVTEMRENGDKKDAISTLAEHTNAASAETVRKKPIVGLLQVAGVIVLIALAFIYSREPVDAKAQSGAPSTGQATPAAAQNTSTSAGKLAPLVSVLKPAASSQQVAITSTGSVVVRSYVTLTPQVSGKVISTSPALRSGGRFSAGQILVTLEKRDFTLGLAQANADVASARASLQLSLAVGSAAVSNYELLNPGETVPTLVAKEPQIAQAKAQLQSAIARRDIQQTNLERSVFSLPFAGRVVESSADQGQILQVGQSFGRVYALDSVEIVTSLAPEELTKIAPAIDRTVTVTADGNIFSAKVNRVAAERDSRSRFSQVFITPNDNQALTPGTFVSITLDGPLIDDTFMLPESALQVGQVFWIVKDGNIAEVSANILGRSDGEYLVKAFDYAQGIVTGSVPGAKQGMPVRLASKD
ncbi:MAG: efflux RND transporter periplasmic adaptor subunit [Pseudomonadales bacterium]|nr:efflux RND transporter periplasmic adaptor subunit [Pseudomonadales bacterium]MDG1441745.1 efflux RND transporter periplasmic adaptor subunit [Pseudomonadales bacterium]